MLYLDFCCWSFLHVLCDVLFFPCRVVVDVRLLVVAVLLFPLFVVCCVVACLMRVLLFASGRYDLSVFLMAGVNGS